MNTAAPPRGFIDPRDAAVVHARLHWEALFLHDRTIDMPAVAKPVVSIIMAARGSHLLAAASLAGLARYLASARASFEVILVDDGPDDAIRRLFPRLRNVGIVESAASTAFSSACDRGADKARGRYLLFLEPGAELLPGALEALVDGFATVDRTGVVGPRLIGADGTLQQAGGGFRNDLQVKHPYLGGDPDPSRPEAVYARATGYVPSAVMMIPRDLFKALGGFDPAFPAGAFEDADLCVRAQRIGRRVVYQPQAVAIRRASPDGDAASPPTDAHRLAFLDRHRAWLFESGAHPQGFAEARDMDRFKLRVLLVDDQTPHLDKGAGLPRANAIVNAMADMGYGVTFLPAQHSDAELGERYRDLDPRIEILAPAGDAKAVQRLARERQGYYDVLWVSRPHNAALVVEALLSMGKTPRDLARRRFILDTEAVFAARDALGGLLNGAPIEAAELWSRMRHELRFGPMADVLVCVSQAEARLLAAIGLTSVAVLSHTVSATPTPRAFDQRRGVLFVGALVHAKSPNVDSVAWLLDAVWPRVRAQLGAGAPLVLAGEIGDDVRARFQRPGVEILGRVASLDAVFDRVRITVAPTRFSGGIPLKIIDSVARGVPGVATPMLRAQLGWPEGAGVVTASSFDARSFADAIVALYRDKSLWTSARRTGLDQVGRRYDAASFRRAIRDLCEGGSAA
jgi:O-antigen biosynthesis protein